MTKNRPVAPLYRRDPACSYPPRCLLQTEVSPESFYPEGSDPYPGFGPLWEKRTQTIIRYRFSGMWQREGPRAGSPPR